MGVNVATDAERLAEVEKALAEVRQHVAILATAAERIVNVIYHNGDVRQHVREWLDQTSVLVGRLPKVEV